jgi:hypothetical protein
VLDPCGDPTRVIEESGEPFRPGAVSRKSVAMVVKLVLQQDLEVRRSLAVSTPK